MESAMSKNIWEMSTASINAGQKQKKRVTDTSLCSMELSAELATLMGHRTKPILKFPYQNVQGKVATVFSPVVIKSIAIIVVVVGQIRYI
jgi:hypothetical protein